MSLHDLRRHQQARRLREALAAVHSIDADCVLMSALDSPDQSRLDLYQSSDPRCRVAYAVRVLISGYVLDDEQQQTIDAALAELGAPKEIKRQPGNKPDAEGDCG